MAKAPVTAVAVEPGRRAACGRRGTRRDPQTVRRGNAVDPPTRKVTSVAFAPDGRRLATGGKQGSATVWSVDGEKLSELDGHSAEITDVAFSADGSRVATASRDATARIWDASNRPTASRARSASRRCHVRRVQSRRRVRAHREPGSRCAALECGHRGTDAGSRTGTSARSPTHRSAPMAAGSSRQAP